MIKNFKSLILSITLFSTLPLVAMKGEGSTEGEDVINVRGVINIDPNESAEVMFGSVRNPVPIKLPNGKTVKELIVKPLEAILFQARVTKENARYMMDEHGSSNAIRFMKLPTKYKDVILIFNSRWLKDDSGRPINIEEVIPLEAGH